MTDTPPAAPHFEGIRASSEVRLGPVFHARSRLRATPAGLVGVGVMVAAILLSVAVIVRAGRVSGSG